MAVPLTRSKDHDCVALGCDVALNGVALADLEIVVAANGAASRTASDVLTQVPKGAALPKKPDLTTIRAWERPFTRRRVA